MVRYQAHPDAPAKPAVSARGFALPAPAWRVLVRYEVTQVRRDGNVSVQGVRLATLPPGRFTPVNKTDSRVGGSASAALDVVRRCTTLMYGW